MSERLGELAVAELLDRLAARTPAPGGGSATATACALAAALVEMAARFGTDPDASSDAQRATRLRAQALELIDRDATAFSPVLAAAHAGGGSADRAARIASARSDAAEPPLAIAVIAAELAELGATRVRAGNPNLTGDALAAVLLAEASARGAAALVALNLPDGADPRRQQAAGAATRAGAVRERALAAASEE